MTSEIKLRGSPGVVPGTFVVLSGGVWSASPLAAQSTAYGVVREASTSYAIVVVHGGIRIPGWGLVAGQTYFPDPVTPGAVVPSVPSTGHSVPVLAALTSEDAFVFGPTYARGYRREFTDGDLAAGILTLAHDLGDDAASVSIRSNTGLVVSASTTVTPTIATVDLTAYSPLAGTWKAVVRR